MKDLRIRTKGVGICNIVLDGGTLKTCVRTRTPNTLAAVLQNTLPDLLDVLNPMAAVPAMLTTTVPQVQKSPTVFCNVNKCIIPLLSVVAVHMDQDPEIFPNLDLESSPFTRFHNTF